MTEGALVLLAKCDLNGIAVPDFVRLAATRGYAVTREGDTASLLRQALLTYVKIDPDEARTMKRYPDDANVALTLDGRAAILSVEGHAANGMVDFAIADERVTLTFLRSAVRIEHLPNVCDQIVVNGQALTVTSITRIRTDRGTVAQFHAVPTEAAG